MEIDSIQEEVQEVCLCNTTTKRVKYPTSFNHGNSLEKILEREGKKIVYLYFSNSSSIPEVKKKLDSLKQNNALSKINYLVLEGIYVNLELFKDYFKEFKNLETIEFQEAGYAKGISNFPSVKHIIFEWTQGYINKEFDELEELESLSFLGKGKMKLQKGVRLEQVKYLEIDWTNLTEDYSFLNTMKCLRELKIDFCSGEKMKLYEVDIKNFLCLEKMQIHSYLANRIKGIPKNIESNKKAIITIEHPALSKKDKDYLDSLNQVRKNNFE